MSDLNWLWKSVFEAMDFDMILLAVETCTFELTATWFIIFYLKSIYSKEKSFPTHTHWIIDVIQPWIQHFAGTNNFHFLEMNRIPLHIGIHLIYAIYVNWNAFASVAWGWAVRGCCMRGQFCGNHLPLNAFIWKIMWWFALNKCDKL